MATTRERQRLETAAAVLAAAGDLFLTRGFAETTIRDIAAACRASVGTVMAVGDKDALLVAVLDEHIRQVHTGRVGPPTSPRERSCVNDIVQQLEPFVTLFTGHPTLAREYAAILVGGNHRSAVFTELAKLLIDEVSVVLISSGCATDQRAAALAEAIYFAYLGRLFTWPTDADDDADKLQQHLRRIITTICTCEEFRP